MKKILSVFCGLAPYEVAEFVAMVLLTISVPLGWRMGLLSLLLFCGVVAAKIVITRRVGNAALSRVGRCSLWLMVLYFLLHLFSVLYSCDTAAALHGVSIKLSMLLIALAVLASDMSYLKPKHLTVLTFCLSATLTLRFVAMLLRAFVGWRGGTPVEDLLDYHFDPLHHNYLALYLLSAVALIFAQVTHHWNRCEWRWQRWAALADMMLLVLYLVIMGSRSGLVILALLAVAGMAYLALVRKRWVATCIVLAGLTLFVGITYKALPELYWRIVYSAQQMAAGKNGDSRQTVWACGLEVLRGHELFGLGSGGYWDALYDSYVAHDFAEGYTHEQFDTHNQYLETTLATGVVGLAVLLAIVVLPVWWALRRKSRNLSLVLFSIVYAGCIFFEATFSRQMGLLFVPWWYALLLTIPEHEVGAARIKT